MSVPPNKALQPTVFTQVELHITLRSIIAQFNLRKKSTAEPKRYAA
jgi:hypothetical protein